MPIPKAELHVHIEGTLEPELAFELAARNHLALPYRDVAELRARYRFEDLRSFLHLYYANMQVLRTRQDFTDLADAYLARAAGQGVRHAEIFFDPQAHTARGVDLGTVIGGLDDALSTSRERFGVSAQLIVCFLRDLGPEAAMATLLAALAYRDRLLGVGLDSAEVGYPPGPFAQVFARARAEGLECVAHAGEEGPPSYIWDALDHLQVSRIDHGVRCVEDPQLMARLRDEAVPLTVCPLSNLRLRGVASMAEHRLPELIAAGLVVTVNSDDPAYFGGYIDDNFSLVAEHLGLDDGQLRQLARNSFLASFLTGAEHDGYLAEVDRYPL